MSHSPIYLVAYWASNWHLITSKIVLIAMIDTVIFFQWYWPVIGLKKKTFDTSNKSLFYYTYIRV